MNQARLHRAVIRRWDGLATEAEFDVSVLPWV